jgi:uridine kinase
MVQVIAISGASSSGKSTLAAALVGAIGDDVAAMLPLDAYYHDLAHLAPADREAVDFDHPGALDLTLFQEHVVALKSGTPVRRPDYDFTLHCRRPESVTVVSRRYLVVEGILVACDPVLRALYDTQIFVDAVPSLRWERRLARDQAERGRTVPSIARFWERAEKAFRQFGEVAQSHADCVVSGEDPVAESVQTVLRCLGN